MEQRSPCKTNIKTQLIKIYKKDMSM